MTTIVDEAYLDFVDDKDVTTVTDLVATGRRVVVLRTFSKIHGMAGVRYDTCCRITTVPSRKSTLF